MLTLMMEILSIRYGWQAPLVVKTSDEMHGMITWEFLPSLDGKHLWVECNIYTRSERKIYHCLYTDI